MAGQQSSHLLRRVLIAVGIGAAFLAGALLLLPSTPSHSEVPFGLVIRDAKAGLVQSIQADGNKLTVTYVPMGNLQVVHDSYIASNTDLVQVLTDEGIALNRSDDQASAAAVNLLFKHSSSFSWFGIFLNILPFLLIGGFLVLIMRQARGNTSEAMTFGRSHARLISGGHVSVTFDDVAGVEEAKVELAEVVQFLKSPEKFAALGAHVPRGLLLLGPPGTGKTLLARAVAGEAGVPFFSISGSEFVEMFVGVGASRVRDLFDQAKKNVPCILFIDEIDAVGRQRGTGLGGSHDEREQTLNQILVEMDGFEPGTNIVVIAATNRPDILDPALLRPGRFDRKVILDNPDIKGREAILKVHVRGKPIADDVSTPTLAKATPGFSGADLANLVNEAAILAARADKSVIAMAEFEEAIERVLAGPERKSRVMTQHERELTAYHEAGHTVVGHFMEHHDRPHKVTIISRGISGGHTRFLPDEEAHYRTQSMLQDQLCTALAGQAAERLVFGESSTGPSNDLEEVTRIARAMVTRWGMSERLGPRTFGRSEELIFLGREISETRNYSERIAEEIDDEVRRLTEEERDRARQVLSEHRALLDKVAAALLEVETLEGDVLTELLESDPNERWTPPVEEQPPEEAPASPNPNGHQPEAITPAGPRWG